MLVEGRLHLQFSCTIITMDTAATVGVVNDGEWHTAEVEVYNTTAFLLVDSNERVNATSEISSSIFEPSSERLYIGGLPSDLQTAIGWLGISKYQQNAHYSFPPSPSSLPLPLSHSPSPPLPFSFSPSPSFFSLSSEVSLAGCVRYLQVREEDITLNSSFTSSRVSFGGCPSAVGQGVRFSGEGMAVLAPLEEEVYHISFAFHSIQLASLLLYIGNDEVSLLFNSLI